MLEYIATRDHRLMRRLNRWHAPRWVRLWMLTATRGGDGWLWCALGAAVLLWGGAERYRTFVAALVACAAGVVIFLRIKPKARRVRPCAIEPHCWARLLPPDQFSFPSGHTITAFAAVVSIGCVYPLLVPVLAFCALSVAASRIVLGMHFLSDVVAGAAIGTGLGYAAHAISLIAA
jgi:undecaprenyl-diphosphatase